MGGAIAMRLAAEQATVAITSRDLSKAKGWAEQREGGKYIPAQLDLADEKSICNCLDYIQSRRPVYLLFSWRTPPIERRLGVPFENDYSRFFYQIVRRRYCWSCPAARQLLTRLTGQPASIVFLSSIYGRAGVDHRIYPPGIRQLRCNTRGEGGSRRCDSLVGRCLGGARSAGEHSRSLAECSRSSGSRVNL